MGTDIFRIFTIANPIKPINYGKSSEWTLCIHTGFTSQGKDVRIIFSSTENIYIVKIKKEYKKYSLKTIKHTYIGIKVKDKYMLVHKSCTLPLVMLSNLWKLVQEGKNNSSYRKAWKKSKVKALWLVMYANHKLNQKPRHTRSVKSK